MAVAGTLQWAREELEDIQTIFANYEELADEMGTTTYAEMGREHLSELENRLEDVIETLNLHDADPALKEEALELYYMIDSSKTLL